jgi:hypothetical protein
MLANRGKLKALQQFKHLPPGVYERIVSTLISPKEQKNFLLLATSQPAPPEAPGLQIHLNLHISPPLSTV